MRKQTKFPLVRLLLGALLLGFPIAAHAGQAVTTPFEAVVEGTAIKTSADAGKLISPLPGIAISVAPGAVVSLVRVQVVKSGDAIVSREVVLKLDEGSISFSIDQRIVDKTRFEVQTPHGRKSVQGAVGTVTVEGSCVKYASLAGKMNITANGSAAPIQLKAGSFLAICGEGANARIRLINAIARTWTDYSANGSPLATRDATAAELESTRSFFSAALAEASMARRRRPARARVGGRDHPGADHDQPVVRQRRSRGDRRLLRRRCAGGRRSTSASGDATASGSFGSGSFNPANTLAQRRPPPVRRSRRIPPTPRAT